MPSEESLMEQCVCFLYAYILGSACREDMNFNAYVYYFSLYQQLSLHSVKKSV
jgi:hypothetical protein